ncbi:hypothetical protein C9374_007290 [Naegleria lovaniensis]|uniref:Uncharacterized protein n=1 Tax=Naegleria lovaniensis TaxID=51637 RepID=A0AA88KSK0_NAELO|nr:uncharacterized protein C9374_007290 [Naegleria lovaniensis]KAG2393759.1 hypothetical protein C9374_007290 [Naegleria lovaniensis]
MMNNNNNASRSNRSNSSSSSDGKLSSHTSFHSSQYSSSSNGKKMNMSPSHGQNSSLLLYPAQQETCWAHHVQPCQSSSSLKVESPMSISPIPINHDSVVENLKELLQMLRFKEQHPNSPLSQYIDSSQVIHQIKYVLSMIQISSENNSNLQHSFQNTFFEAIPTTATTMNRTPNVHAVEQSQQFQPVRCSWGSNHSDSSSFSSQGQQPFHPPPCQQQVSSTSSQGCFPLKLELTERDLFELFFSQHSSTM